MSNQLVTLDKDHMKELVLLQNVPKYIAISALVQLAIAVLLSIITLIYGLKLTKVSTFVTKGQLNLNYITE